MRDTFVELVVVSAAAASTFIIPFLALLTGEFAGTR
jgi:hypothetical protein